MSREEGIEAIREMLEFLLPDELARVHNDVYAEMIRRKIYVVGVDRDTAAI